jgi:hypothetical protein
MTRWEAAGSLLCRSGNDRKNRESALRGIVPATAPGVAAGDAFEGFPRAAPRAVLVDGVDGVLATRGLVAAVAAKERAERDAVEQDELNQEPAHLNILARVEGGWMLGVGLKR